MAGLTTTSSKTAWYLSSIPRCVGIIIDSKIIRCVERKSDSLSSTVVVCPIVKMKWLNRARRVTIVVGIKKNRFGLLKGIAEYVARLVRLSATLSDVPQRIFKPVSGGISYLFF